MRCLSLARLVRPTVFRLLAVAVAAATIGVSLAPAQTVLYRETFGRPDPATGNQPTINWDWIRFNAAGTVGTLTNGVSSDGTGKPTDLANTPSAGPNADGTFDAYVEGWTYMDGTQVLEFTTEFSFDPVAAAPVSFNWWQGAAYNGTPGLNEAKIAIRIGTNWYVSAESFTNTPVTAGANFGSTDPSVAQGAEEKHMDFSPAADKWLTLTFDGDYDPVTNIATASTLGAIVVGAAPEAPLSGTITAFGLYRAVTGANMRMDNFEIRGTSASSGVNPDFNHDNRVDGSDFIIWQRHVGAVDQPDNTTGDANSDHKVDRADFLAWKDGYAKSVAAIAGVPEPGAMALFAVAAAGLLTQRGRRRAG
jgi:hypothetical protein